MRNARGAPAHRNACSIPETAHPTANAGFRMRRLSNGNRILVGRRSLSCGSCRDLLTDPFSWFDPTPLVRLSHPTDARRRVGQANHQETDGLTRGSPSVQSNAQTREEHGPPDCVLHPGDRASHGKRWCSDAPFVKWKPDPGGPALALLWFLPRLVNRSFFVVRSHSAGPLVPPYGCEA